MAVNVDATMLEMFRSEVETHLAALNEGLLALEKQPRQTERFEPLMRAAHSIKGAAKIVGLPAAVQVAHAIEDCFVAVRDRRAEMSSELVDALLESVDLLARAADVDDGGQVALDEGDARVYQAAAGIASAMRGAPSQQRTARKGEGNSDTSASASAPCWRAPARLCGAWAAENREHFVSAISAGDSAAKLDLSEVETIDAAALGFLALATQARDRSPGAVLHGARPDMARLLHAVGLKIVQPAPWGE